MLVPKLESISAFEDIRTYTLRWYLFADPAAFNWYLLCGHGGLRHLADVSCVGRQPAGCLPTQLTSTPKKPSNMLKCDMRSLRNRYKKEFFLSREELTLRFTNLHSIRPLSFIRDDQIKRTFAFLLIR